jgi:nicotinamidase-related amidase
MFNCNSKTWTALLDQGLEDQLEETYMDNRKNFEASGLMFFCKDVRDYQWIEEKWTAYKPQNAWDEPWDCIYDDSVENYDELIDEAQQEYLFWINFSDWATKQYLVFYKEFDPNPEDAPNGYYEDYYPIYDGYEYDYPLIEDYNYDYHMDDVPPPTVDMTMTEDEVMDAFAAGLADMFKSGDEKIGSADSTMTEDEVMDAFAAGLADMFAEGDN